MAAPPENGALMHMHSEELEFEGGYGCCFRPFWSRSQRHIGSYDYDDDQSSLLSERTEHHELWIVTQVKKLREVSELVAGPKWKNFIRKIGAYFNNKKTKNFRYDSHDYGLNFDNGFNEDDDEEGVNLGFSSRFAPPVHDKTRSST